MEAPPADTGLAPPTPGGGLRGLNFFRSRSVPPGSREDGKAVSAPGTPLPTNEPLPSILKEGGDLSVSPLPEPAPAPASIAAATTTNTAANAAAAPGAAAGARTLVRSGSLPQNVDGTGAIPLEAMLRAGAGVGRRGRAPTTGVAPRGRFKSNPITGLRSEGGAGEPADTGAPAPSGTVAAAAIPIDEGDNSGKRTSILAPEPTWAGVSGE
jgi:hypothetical protein